MTAARRTTRRRSSRRRGIEFTAEGYQGLVQHVERLQAELEGLRDLMADPQRDERLMLDVERLLGEVDAYNALIAQAGVLDQEAADSSDTVVLGSKVVIAFEDGDREVVRIVHPAEAFLDDERVSAQSPLAVAALGLRAGESGEFSAPGGRVRFTVEEIGRVLAPTG
jgi:transcription elongation GreA/GreB family factor